MIAAVLCGGRGTRLRDQIGEHQKCAVDVGGRPWIHRVLDVLQAAGIETAILLTGYQHEEVEAAAAAWDCAGNKQGRAFLMGTWLMHSEPTNTEAAIQFAFARTAAENLLVMNGDTILLEGFDLRGFLDACELGRRPVPRNVFVRGQSETGDPVIVDAGISFRARWTRRSSKWPAIQRFLDIGTPEGLAAARRRFAK